jgi:hypothetical protein
VDTLGGYETRMKLRAQRTKSSMKSSTDVTVTVQQAAQKFAPRVAPNLQKTEKVSSQGPGAFVQRAMKAKARLHALA